MSRTYTFSPTGIYGGRTTNRNLYMSTMQPWADGNRVGCWKQGSTEYYGAVSFFFNFGPVIGKTIQSITLTPVCSGTFAWSEEVIYDQKSTDSITDWTIPSYAHESTVERYGVIPSLDVTAFGIPLSDAYVIGGYYRSYAYVDITGATLTVVTAETIKTVSYNANGGSGAPSPTTLWGETVWDGYISDVVPTRTGYRFDGWNTQANGSGTSYASGAYISVSADTTLYAQWTALSSVISTASDANITEATTITWANYGNFTNKIRFVFGSVDSGEIAVSGTSYQYTLPSSWYNQIPNTTSGTATVYLYTYASGTLIGTSSKTFTAYVKSTVVPSISNPTSEGVNLKWGLYLQKYSSVKISVTGGAAGTGATIKSYSITGQGLNYSVNTTATSANATSAVLTTSGTATYTVTITDSRNRTVQKTVSITVTAYAEPTTSLTGVRCNSDGTVNPTTGTSIKATAFYTWTAVGQNYVTGTISYKKHTDPYYTTALTSFVYGAPYVIADGLAEISSSYDVKVEISDGLGNSASYVVVVPPVVGISFGLKNDRARFGGPCEKGGLQIDWPVDITPRRSYATLSQAGWYRVIVFDAMNQYDMKGAVGGVIKITIARKYYNADNEAHTIDLFLTYESIKFANEESVSNVLGIDQIRYNTKTDGTTHYGYVDIHYYLSQANPVVVSFDVTVASTEAVADNQLRFSSANLASVSPSPQGETEVTRYTFVANTGVKITFTPTSGSVYRACWYARIGNVCYLHIDMSGLTPNTNTSIFTLPVGFRPEYQTCIQGQGQESYGALAFCAVSNTGAISVYSNDHYALIDGSFICIT